MAYNIIFKKGLFENLPTTSAEGTLCFATDQGVIRLFKGANDFIDFDGRVTEAEFDALAAAVGTSDNKGTLFARIASIETALGNGGSVAEAITNAINKLDFADTAETGKYVSAVNEVDGVISVTRESLPDYSKTYDAFGAATTAETNAKAYADGLAKNYDAAGAAKAVQGETTTTVKSIEDSVTAIKDGTSIDSFADVETALSGKQPTGDYATKTEAQGYANAKDEAIAAAQNAADTAQADVDALETLVGTLPAGATATDIVGYINEKTAGIATDTALKELQDAVDAIEADYLTSTEKTELSNATKAVQDNVDALSDKVGEVPADKTVVQMIAEAQTAATYDDTEVRGLISTNTDAIGVLNGEATVEGSVKKTVADEIAKVVADAPESFDTLKEISDWISTHGTDAAAMNSAILALQNIVAGIGGDSDEHKTVVAYVDAAIAALNIGDYAKAADLTTLAGRVTTIENDYLKAADKTELEGKITAAQTAAEKVANDNNAAMDIRVKALEAIDHDAYKAYADQAETDAIATAAADATTKADAAKADAIASANAYTDTALTWSSF